MVGRLHDNRQVSIVAQQGSWERNSSGDIFLPIAIKTNVGDNAQEVAAVDVAKLFGLFVATG